MGVLMLQRSMEMDEIAVEEGGEAERRWIQEEIRRREDEEGEGYGKETDWWSFGVVLYEVKSRIRWPYSYLGRLSFLIVTPTQFFFGQPPFFEDNVQDTYDKISDHRVIILAFVLLDPFASIRLADIVHACPTLEFPQV
jgi:serine/threonine protein kinase